MTKTAWRYEIKYGPEGEANYAWVYDADGEMVCTAKTYHAEAIVTRMNALASIQGEDAVERVARIIDPQAWRDRDYYDDYRRIAASEHHATKSSITKARAILATGLVAGEAEPVPADPLDDLVARFSAALLEKLKAAREKYGYGDEGWRDDDWMGECQIKLLSHLVKGDPRDVAAYCAFMWHHGWPTIAPDDELNGCREALRKVTVKNAQNEAKISDLNDMVLRYMHRAEISESAIRADEREKCAKVACDCATAIGNGAALSSESSLDFIELLPGEIAKHTDKLRRFLKCARDEGTEALDRATAAESELSTLRARVREVVGPFAKYVEVTDSDWAHDSSEIGCTIVNGLRHSIKLGHLRAARQLMEEVK